MASYNKFNSFVEFLAEGKINLETDAHKVVLSNSAPAAGNQVLADITEIAGGNGYTTGGLALTVASSGQTGGTYKLVFDDITITAVGGSIGPFRYICIVDTTPTSPNKPLVGWFDYGQSITLAAGEGLLLDFSPSNGVLQIV